MHKSIFLHSIIHLLLLLFLLPFKSMRIFAWIQQQQQQKFKKKKERKK